MGKLRRIRDPATETVLYSATYDAAGDRVTQTQGGVTHTFSYGAGLLRDDTATGSTTYTPGISQRNGTTDLFPHEDWLGSTRYLTDATGLTAPTAYRFDAYGNTSASGGPDSTVLKFGGQHEYQSDLPLGLQQLGARVYDPAAGRFLNPDPIGFAGGANLYRYCSNDPVGLVDPSGLRETGSYLGDVAEVFKGYGDVLNPVGWWQGIRGVYQIGRTRGVGAAGGAMASGIWHGFTDWLTTDDPRAFGQSFGTVLLTAAPGMKRIPSRFIGRGGGLARSAVEGAAGAATGAACAADGAQAGRVISVFHKGDLAAGVVKQRMKPFSTGMSAAEVDSVIGGAKPIHRFDIPEAVLTDWLRRGWAQEHLTRMGNQTLKEIRFGPRAQPLLNQYRVGGP
jgi:RHS repeat-associated protein